MSNYQFTLKELEDILRAYKPTNENYPTFVKLVEVFFERKEKEK